MLVNNKSQRFIYGQGVKLYPGVNEVDPKAWEKLEKGLKGELEKGLVTVICTVDKNGKEAYANFEDLSPNLAEKAVRETFNGDLLRKWKAETTKDSIRIEINKQLDELKEPITKEN